ncbi:MAG: hypothetical protein KAT12_07420 [Gammaproteobacteria bacterium]|nr:hypothetical protein [Gammaproteobacteria bacterium]
MKNRLPIIKPLVFACSVALAACSSGGDSVVPATTITGTAEAPQGVIAQLEYNKSFLVAVVEYTFSAAIAGITGLEPVTGATVELIRIDDDGNQVGEVLATTSTSITGDYSLALPTGVSLAGNLIVRITGNSGASMSAMVVEEAVDINPISQFVLDKFVDDENLVLADLAVNEVVSLQGKVEEFDLTATADLTTMLAQLEAEVGQFVDNEIAIIEAVADDGTAAAAAAGDWNIVEFSVGMHDSDPNTSGILYGTFAMDIISEGINIADAGNGGLTLTIGSSLIDTFTNYSVDDQGNTNIYHEISLGESGDSFPAMIDADSNVTLSFPFEEELQTVDVGGANDPEGDGPDYGWRYPPATYFMYPAANGTAYVSMLGDNSVRYETTDTNGDGINDAVDPNARSGDEVSLSQLMLLRQGSGMTTADISGNYGMVAFNINLDTAPVAVYDSTVGVVSFNPATDEATIATGAFDKEELTRSPATLPAVTLNLVASTEPLTDDVIPYTVSATGLVTIDPGVNALEGFASADGSIMAFVDDESTGAPTVTNVNDEMLVMVELGTNMAASLNGATYKLIPLILAMGESGYSEIVTLGNGAVTFNADSSTATLDGSGRGIYRGNDVAEVEAITATSVTDVLTVDSVAANGAVTMSATDGNFSQTLEGYVSADGNMLILRNVGSDSVAGEYDMGMVIGIKQ